MNRYLHSALAAALGLAAATSVLAQDTTSPAPTVPRDQTSTTQTPSDTSSSSSSSTATPSRHASAKSSHKQMMKDCVAKERADNSTMSASAARKACKAQMKSNGSESKNY